MKKNDIKKILEDNFEGVKLARMNLIIVALEELNADLNGGSDLCYLFHRTLINEMFLKDDVEELLWLGVVRLVPIAKGHKNNNIMLNLE